MSESSGLLNNLIRLSLRSESSRRRRDAGKTRDCRCHVVATPQHEAPNCIGRARRRGPQPDVGLVLFDDLAGVARSTFQQVRAMTFHQYGDRSGDEGILEGSFLHVLLADGRVGRGGLVVGKGRGGRK